MKTLLILTLGLFVCGNAYAEIPDEQAIKALIGEAGGQSYQELYAHACALRNRNTLEGVYGIRSKQVALASGKTWQRVSRAWYESVDGLDVTGGATHWLSEYDLENCSHNADWRFTMIMTGKIGQTYFYKEK